MNLTKHDWMLIVSSLHSRAAAMELEQDPTARNPRIAEAQRLRTLARRIGAEALAVQGRIIPNGSAARVVDDRRPVVRQSIRRPVPRRRNRC